MNGILSGSGSDCPLVDASNSATPDHTRSALRPDKRSGFLDRVFNRGTGNEEKSSWKSVAYSSTKVVIDVVKESSDIFPPLKSIAGGLAAILKHYDVGSFPQPHI